MARTAVRPDPQPIAQQRASQVQGRHPHEPLGATESNEAWRKTVSAELAMALLDVGVQAEEDMAPWEWQPKPTTLGQELRGGAPVRPRPLPPGVSRPLRGVEGATLCGKILLLIRNGVPPIHAAAFEGVDVATWREWRVCGDQRKLEPYRTFIKDVRQARAFFLAKMQQHANKEAEHDGHLALKILENHFPKVYGRQRQAAAQTNVSFSFTSAAVAVHDQEMKRRALVIEQRQVDLSEER